MDPRALAALQPPLEPPCEERERHRERQVHRCHDEARLERGINVSTIHIDLMVGGPEVDVDGIGADGSVVAILDQGRWVLS